MERILTTEQDIFYGVRIGTGTCIIFKTSQELEVLIWDTRKNQLW